MAGCDDEHTVLIVDDEKGLADLYATWLREEFAVTTAYGGHAALETVTEGDVDVVLLDRHMPDLSGDIVLTVLRDRGYDMPVAMVTGVEPEFSVLDLGFDQYILKPVDAEELTATVRELIEVESYDALERTLSELRVKRNVLQVEYPDSELERSEEFSRLERRIGRFERKTQTYQERVASTQGAATSAPGASHGD